MSQGENSEEPPPAASYTSPCPEEEMAENYDRLGSSGTIKVNKYQDGQINIGRSTRPLELILTRS